MSDTITTRPQCSVDECDNLARSIRSGLCGKHYRQFADKSTCTVEGCRRYATSHVSGVCAAHKRRLNEFGDVKAHLPIGYRSLYKQEWCAVDGCESRVNALGYCAGHYTRLVAHGSVLADKPFRPKYKETNVECSFDGCDRLAREHGLCGTHSTQSKQGKVLTPIRPLVRTRAPGEGSTSKEGYSTIWLDGRRVLEHRFVMEKIIGRKLLPGETVHHRNGRRTDNRPSNLELKASHHGSGQTIPDLLAWAHEIIDRYET